MNTNPSSLSAALCRWIARIVGILLVLLIVILAIGEGMPNPFTQPAKVQLGFLALALLMIGILLGWRWEFAGAILSLVGWFMFLPLVIPSPKGPNGFVLAMALPGIMYLISAFLRRYREKRTLT